jgi:outer membrane usher protein
VALITDLNAYEDNKISIDPTSLPMDVEIDGDTLFARAWPRAGLFVDFPIRRTRGALVILSLADGSPAPLGATVTLRPGGPEARVAERGEVWLTDLADDNHLAVNWRGGACFAALAAPRSIALGDKLGPAPCLPGTTK